MASRLGALLNCCHHTGLKSLWGKGGFFSSYLPLPLYKKENSRHFFDVYKKGKNISDEELKRYIEVSNALDKTGASDEMREYEKMNNDKESYKCTKKQRNTLLLIMVS